MEKTTQKDRIGRKRGALALRRNVKPLRQAERKTALRFRAWTHDGFALGPMIIFYLLSFIWLSACSQPGGLSTANDFSQTDNDFSQPDSGDDGDLPDYTDDSIPLPKIYGIEITEYPRTLFARNEPFTSSGLEVMYAYDDGTLKGPLTAEQYTVSSINTAAPGADVVTVRAVTGDGTFTARYGIYIDTSDSVLGDFRMLTAPTKTGYELGQAFSTAGMKVEGVYAGGEKAGQTVAIDAASVTPRGYDKTKRGTQTVALMLNGQKLGTHAVTVKIPQNAKVTLNTAGSYPNEESVHEGLLIYKRVWLKGEAFSRAKLEPFSAKIEANKTVVVLTYKEGGGLTDAEKPLSGYDPDAPGEQVLSFTVDGFTVPIDIAVLDAEPLVYFDYGYVRTEGDPNGAGPGAGCYYTKPNAPLVLSPVRFLIGYDEQHAPAACSYAWSVTVPAGGAYNTAAAANDEFFRFTPTAAGTYKVKVKVSGRNYIGGAIIEREAETEVVCYTGTVGTPPGKTYQSPLKNFAPGQFAGGETSGGLGWSLGSAMGYEVWTTKTSGTVKITGNGFPNWGEPGIVWIQADENGNGIPDEMWYEVTGSDDNDSVLKSHIVRRYAIKHIKGDDWNVWENFYSPLGDGCHANYWVDSKGRVGMSSGGRLPLYYIGQTRYAYYTGTLLRDGGVWLYNHPSPAPLYTAKGYVDCYDGSQTITVDKSNAINAAGEHVNVSNIAFVKVQTGIAIFQSGFGEYSTEIVSGTGLPDQSNGFPNPLGSVSASEDFR